MGMFKGWYGSFNLTLIVMVAAVTVAAGFHGRVIAITLPDLILGIIVIIASTIALKYAQDI